MSESIKSEYLTHTGTGRRIAVTTKEPGNIGKSKQHLEVLGSMITYVNVGLAMLHLCDRFATVSSVPGIGNEVATGITNTALECASVMWFCAGMDVNSANKDARGFVAEWKKHLTPHNRKLFKGIRDVRNELHGHRGGRRDRQHKRDVSVRLMYLFGDLGERMVHFNVGDDADDIKRLFERIPEAKRAEWQRLMSDASNWLTDKFVTERDSLSNRLLGGKEGGDLVKDRSWRLSNPTR